MFSLTSFSLPYLTSFVQRHNKWRRFATIISLILIMYLTTNRWHLFAPSLVPRTWLDNALPFLPATVYIYASYFFTIFSVFLLEDDEHHLNVYALGLLGLNVFCNIIFIFYPTTYDARPALPEGAVPWMFDALFDFIYFFDSPANCLPSLHVANSFISTLTWYRRRNGLFWGYLLWTVLISLSTLTTKQHYFYDVLTGMGAAALWYFGILYYFRNKLAAAPQIH
jgi:membrane-associated phospholipid phosphatase